MTPLSPYPVPNSASGIQENAYTPAPPSPKTLPVVMPAGWSLTQGILAIVGLLLLMVGLGFGLTRLLS